MRFSVCVGKFGEAPIYLHATTFALIVWFLFRNDILVSLWGFFLFTALILLHELGHAWVCRLVGAKVESIVVALFVGFCVYTHDPESDERDYMLIAWGGVFVQFAILLVALLFFQLFTGSISMPGYVRSNGMGFDSMTWHVLVILNIIMITANLLPFDDLDGETAWGMNPLRAARAMWVFANRPAR